MAQIMAVDNGPASGNAEIIFATPGNAAGSGGFAQVTGVEVHVGNPSSGLNPLGPASAPYVDPSQVGTNVQGNPIVPINKTVNFGGVGVGSILIVNPA
jgi:hypothetical protein